MAHDHFYTSSDGLQLYAKVYGDKEKGFPVLCLPGLTRNCRDFEDLAQHLEPNHMVICAEQRGRGKSAYDPEWKNYQPLTYVSDMITLLDSVDVPKVLVIGTSLGGIMATLLSAMHADRIVGVIINDIGPEIDPKGLERIRSYAGKTPPVETWEEAAGQIAELNSEAFPDYDAAMWMKMAKRTFKEVDGRPIADYDANISKPFSDPAGASDVDMWPVYQMLRPKPLLIIRGDRSDILSADTFERMQKETPDASSAIIPNRGHAPMLDEPSALSAIDAFVAEIG